MITSNKTVLLFFFLCFWLTAQSQNFAPDITVALDGTGDFTKIQEAINAVPDNSSEPTVIFIKRGLYDTEKLFVPSNKENVVFIGESRDETIISYHIYDCSTNGKCPAGDAALWTGDNIRTSATLTIHGDGFQAENLTIQNTAGPVGQAQAITVRADKVVFRNCNLTGYQDTVYLWSDGNRIYFDNCLILGRTDYIYGGGTAFFQSCEIRSWGGGWITAPSTSQDQAYGYVFNECRLTYALDSPRPGDDGALVAFGRPWHNYPKVAWLFCEMTEKIHPQGWPDKWNMDYADTSPDLHLYEYKNTGAGANTSQRANWAGIKELTDEEALNYTVQDVLNGQDGWDPTAMAPVIPTYNWTGNGESTNWLLADNWNPIGIPDTGEAAIVDGLYTISAEGEHFAADLSLLNGATLEVTDTNQVTYLAVANAQIKGTDQAVLEGRIRTKDSLSLLTPDTFSLAAELSGVHHVKKLESGTLHLKGNNSGFSGYWDISAGTLAADGANSLGEARAIWVDNMASLLINHVEAYYVKTPLYVKTGSQLILNADVILNEFYLNGELQPVGQYSAATHPDLISGSGTITIGRPSSFTFVGGGNGNWDNPEHFVPALLPQAGETVLCDREMETTSFVFPADIILQGGGRIRLRGTHSATGTIFMESGTSFRYATSGAGFTLDVPVVLLGDVEFGMNSRATPEHAMRLGGNISGDARIKITNQRTDSENTAIVILSGDNSDFTGIWDLNQPSGHPNSNVAIQCLSANALGNSLVEIDLFNKLILSHEKSAGDTLQVNLLSAGRIQLDTEVKVSKAIINGASLPDGSYNAQSAPDKFAGEGSLIVGELTDVDEVKERAKIYFAKNRLFVKGQESELNLFNLNGQPLIVNSRAKELSLEHLPKGIYFARFIVDGKRGSQKIIVQ